MFGPFWAYVCIIFGIFFDVLFDTFFEPKMAMILMRYAGGGGSPQGSVEGILCILCRHIWQAMTEYGIQDYETNLEHA